MENTTPLANQSKPIVALIDSNVFVNMMSKRENDWQNDLILYLSQNNHTKEQTQESINNHFKLGISTRILKDLIVNGKVQAMVHQLSLDEIINTKHLYLKFAYSAKKELKKYINKGKSDIKNATHFFLTMQTNSELFTPNVNFAEGLIQEYTCLSVNPNTKLSQPALMYLKMYFKFCVYQLALNLCMNNETNAQLIGIEPILTKQNNAKTSSKNKKDKPETHIKNFIVTDLQKEIIELANKYLINTGKPLIVQPHEQTDALLLATASYYGIPFITEDSDFTHNIALTKANTQFAPGLKNAEVCNAFDFLLTHFNKELQSEIYSTLAKKTKIKPETIKALKLAGYSLPTPKNLIQSTNDIQLPPNSSSAVFNNSPKYTRPLKEYLTTYYKRLHLGLQESHLTLTHGASKEYKYNMALNSDDILQTMQYNIEVSLQNFNNYLNGVTISPSSKGDIEQRGAIPGVIHTQQKAQTLWRNMLIFAHTVLHKNSKHASLQKLGITTYNTEVDQLLNKTSTSYENNNKEKIVNITAFMYNGIIFKKQENKVLVVLTNNITPDLIPLLLFNPQTHCLANEHFSQQFIAIRQDFINKHKQGLKPRSLEEINNYIKLNLFNQSAKHIYKLSDTPITYTKYSTKELASTFNSLQWVSKPFIYNQLQESEQPPVRNKTINSIWSARVADFEAEEKMEDTSHKSTCLINDDNLPEAPEINPEDQMTKEELAEFLNSLLN